VVGDDGEPSAMTHLEEDGDGVALCPPSTTASTRIHLEKDEDLGLCSCEVSDVDNGLSKDLDFEDGLSQGI
jgi:hypothetical protein